MAQYKVISCKASEFGGFNIKAEKGGNELQYGTVINTRIKREATVGEMLELAGTITKVERNDKTYNILVLD